jgi:hypothetical protein
MSGLLTGICGGKFVEIGAQVRDSRPRMADGTNCYEFMLLDGENEDESVQPESTLTLYRDVLSQT